MDLLFVPASFSPTTLVVKPSVLLSPRASHKPPPEAAAAAAAPLSSATIRRPLNPPFRQTSPVEPDTAPSTALKPSTTNPLAPKLWLSSKLSPPPPPPPLPPTPPVETLPSDSDVEGPPSPAVNPDSMADTAKYRVKGKIFVGNLPRLDDGSQQRARKEEKMNWVAGSDRREYKSKWHVERGNASNRFVKVLDTKPEVWQAVVSAFDKIPKPSLGDYLLMVKYYARRGDKHHARATFESMRARGIEPDERIFTSCQRYAWGFVLR
ncbi:pentatricopeptide repeat-containing protein At5g04810, chloroplastic-like isoform X2 [Zingiber officinale]|uniref:pentatricopeptide repeat-containing protein At5g04810, chloroplastic-like isoform X2 n=1 Tax=Zingiber officinale TaxID=94328 RepID=UPI001C4CF747|nr:pentatricopeptide repeat-containing protein At5g04810, chloroplastic-like isoform X2 [Zingiber officinale]XP_042410903.1 pentatricopeptide repeat-containing protein At5g04810, chloroplastic-like isoform X2 [Zingiber officinale]